MLHYVGSLLCRSLGTCRDADWYIRKEFSHGSFLEPAPGDVKLNNQGQTTVFD